jgi:DnaJ-domain-containing protein 1
VSTGTGSFVDAAGPRLARSPSGLWRQVALLGVASAVAGGRAERLGLASALLALDHPDEAATIVSRMGDDPWALWLGVLAVGQADGARLGAALAAARSAPLKGADGREVARRLGDLAHELAALQGEDHDARFALLGHSAGPPPRVLLVGRSSAAYVADPSADGVGVVRLAPYEGTNAGNQAHEMLLEIVRSIGDGAAGLVREVPSDRPEGMAPAAMLDALREDPSVDLERMKQLAEDVRRERQELASKIDEVENELASLIAERARLRRVPTPSPTSNGDASDRPLPRTGPEAAAVLGLGRNPSTEQIERTYRELVRSCHPDRVAGLHPAIRREAEGLTVAINAAREILLGARRRR